MNKKTAKVVLIANLKGPREKRQPLTVIADAVETLLEDKEYDHNVKKLATDFRVTRQIIDEFRKVAKQPPEIKKLIEERKLGLDDSTKLSSIPDIKKRIEFAKAVQELSEYDVRSIIEYWKKHPELTVNEAKKIVLESKTVTRDVHAVVIPLEGELFEKFSKYARDKKIRLEDAAKLAIERLVTQAEQSQN